MIYYISSILIGALAVLQAGINRNMAKSMGLPFAILINSAVVLVFAFALWIFLYKYSDSYGGALSPKNSLENFKWWYVIPAVCGFLLILGIPSSIPKIGAQSVFLCVVVGQMIFSLIWDLKYEGQTIEPMRVVGVIIALIGLLMSSWKTLF